MYNEVDMSILLIVLVVLVVILLIWGVAVYNRFVRLSAERDSAAADIDVQLKRRHDLIPNLVSTVQGYAKHEKSVFEEVTEARGKAVNTSVAEDPKAAAQAESALSAGIGRLLAVAEQYPDLKASQNFSELQQELSATEDKLAAARRYYNSTVQSLQARSGAIPDRFVWSVSRFHVGEYFEVDSEAEKMAPEVSFE